MSEDVSSKIKNMALVCAVLVVGIHVKWPHDTAFSLGWFGYHFIKEGIACIAVPFFFTVPGFFLGRHFGEDGWWRRAVFKRVLSLVVPFYIWCLVAVLITVPLSLLCFAWNRVGLDSLETVRALAMYVFGILVPMLVHAFLKRRFPRLSAIAFGGR